MTGHDADQGDANVLTAVSEHRLAAEPLRHHAFDPVP